MAQTSKKSNRMKLMAGLLAGGGMAIAGLMGSAVANAEPAPPVLNGEPLEIPWPGGAWAGHNWAEGWPGGAWAGADLTAGWPGGAWAGRDPADGWPGGAWNAPEE